MTDFDATDRRRHVAIVYLVAVPLLIALVMYVASARATCDESEDRVENILARIGIKDEPSVLGGCNESSSSIRVTALAGGGPFAIFRIEFDQGAGRLIKRSIEDSRPKSTYENSLSESEWVTLVELLRDSGFWVHQPDEDHWRPHSHMLWIEACVGGDAHSTSIYPELDNRMSGFMDYLALKATN